MFRVASSRFGKPVLFLFLILVATGCANTRWKGQANNAEHKEYVEPGFGFDQMKGHTLAVGGVVMVSGLRLDEYSGVTVPPREFTSERQAEYWASEMDGALLALGPDVSLRFWHSVRESISPELFASSLERYAGRGTLKPMVLEEWKASMPGIDYLALARIENTWIDGTGQGDYALSEGLGRVVVITLDIYDLRVERPVWSSMIQKHVRGGFSAPESSAQASDQMSGGTDVPGTTKAATTVSETLDDALGETVKKLKKTKQ